MKMSKGIIRYSVIFEDFCLDDDLTLNHIDEWDAVLKLRDCKEVDFAYYAVFEIDWDVDMVKHYNESVEMIQNILKGREAMRVENMRKLSRKQKNSLRRYVKARWYDQGHTKPEQFDCSTDLTQEMYDRIIELNVFENLDTHIDNFVDEIESVRDCKVI